MNKSTMTAALSAKIDELLNEMEAMEKNLNLSANTVKTQTQLKKHEVRNLIIMKTLLEGKDLEGDVMKWFESTGGCPGCGDERRDPGIPDDPCAGIDPEECAGYLLVPDV